MAKSTCRDEKEASRNEGVTTYKLSHVLIDMTSKTQHHAFSQFAGANPVHPPNLLILKHIPNHGENGFKILRSSGEMFTAELDEIIQCRQHVLEVQFGAGFECGMNQLKCLPHGWGYGLGGERAAVDDFKDFIVEICHVLVDTRGD